MGSSVGVHTNADVKGLSDEEKALLKEHVLHHLQSSEEIRRIIINKKGALPGFLKKNKEIQKILKRKARPFLNRLKKK